MRLFKYGFANLVNFDRHVGVVFSDGTVVVHASAQEARWGNTFQIWAKGEDAVKEYFAGSPGEFTWDHVDDANQFQLRRLRDVTGVSGEGVVAEGVQFPDGTAVVRWIVGPENSTVLWDSVTAAMVVHGHDGNTVLEWLN